MKLCNDNIECKAIKIAFIGDTHFTHLTPKSRIDDFAETCILKLGLLRDNLKQRGVSVLIMLGDIFHTPKQPVELLNRIAKEFIKFKEQGIDVLSITGNHCIFNERLDSLDKTSLGLFYETGIVKPLGLLSIKTPTFRVNIRGVHFPNDIPSVTDFDSYNICVAHKFFEYDLSEETLREDDLEKYGYNMYVLGHDHVPYDLKEVESSYGTIKVVRPGSFTRGTSHSYNVKRLVYYDILSINGGINIYRETLPVKPPEEIFRSASLEKVNNSELMGDLTKKFNLLVSRIYTDESSDFDVYSIIDNVTCDERVKKRLETYLQAIGVFRNSFKN